MKSFIATVTLAVLAAKASARTFTVVNNCPFTIWSVSSLSSLSSRRY